MKNRGSEKRENALRRAVVQRAKEITILLCFKESPLSLKEQSIYFAWINLIFEVDSEEFSFFAERLGFGFINPENFFERNIVKTALKMYMDVYRNPIAKTRMNTH